eukprot:Seg167.8 transcript_id=Seg167.8/GoldUCD/mRNA.D3Y31 product="hypothetical protein" protein_id=Seg167.8/GoldUCD/D3Y31
MDSKTAFLSFLERINDGYVSGHTINSLITDTDYQRLTIKNGKAVGTPLGNRHILPGYWFTVLIAPFEALDRVIDCVRIEHERDVESNNNDDDLWQLADDIKAEFEQLLLKVCPPIDVREDTFPNKKPLVHMRNAIAHGCYDLSEVNGNVQVTFTDYDQLCGYYFTASIAVTILNKFASEFLLQMSELLYPMIEKHKRISKMVQKVARKNMFS